MMSRTGEDTTKYFVRKLFSTPRRPRQQERPGGTTTTHLYSPSTHADADKVKKINNFSVSTQLSLELK